ncbi:hypothetical protein ZWY2020_037585 [Hordeum vulgare]|nr:hypothetical protein ZWY2020_037585 [Hordeum vulgare]
MSRFARLGSRVHQCRCSSDPDASPAVRINGVVRLPAASPAPLAIKADVGPIPTSTIPSSSLSLLATSIYAATGMSSESDSDGVASGGFWPSSLTVAEIEDLSQFGLPVPPSAKLPRLWRIFADGHPTLGPPASREERWRHPGDRYNTRGRRRFWTAAATRPAPPEQVALHQDGDPDDRYGLLAALAQSAEEAVRLVAEEALDEAQAVALEAAAEEDDWLMSSSDDGDDDGGDAVIDLSGED